MHTYNSTVRSARFLYSLNGAPYEEYITEASDTTNKIPTTSILPVEHTGGPYTIDVMFAAEQDGDILEVPRISVIFERKS